MKLINKALNTGFDAYTSEIELSRDTQAYIGDGTGAVSVNDPNDPSMPVATGLVRVHAENRDGANAGIDGKVVSDLFGQHTNTVTKDDVLASVAGLSSAAPATMNVGALEVSAINSASYSADSKVSENDVTGATRAYVSFANIGNTTAASAVTLSASDTSSYTALSRDFQANFLDFPSIEFEKASAINQINKPTQAYISDSDVDVSSGDISIAATNNAQILARAEAVTTIDTTDILDTYCAQSRWHFRGQRDLR